VRWTTVVSLQEIAAVQLNSMLSSLSTRNPQFSKTIPTNDL
jgi:hypothetical protein